MRWFTVAALSVCLATALQAHHPDKEHQRVHPRIDLIPPLGSRLPSSYRRRFNRPTNLGGRIAYHIAPSSQEAMAWHDATHRRAYKDHRPRLEMHYFYPKPWDALKIGARPETTNLQDVEDIKSPLPDFEAGETLQDAVERTDRAVESLESLQDSGPSPSDAIPAPANPSVDPANPSVDPANPSVDPATDPTPSEA
ncbi:MAG: hypothetical protein ACR2NZ_17045 [Rubripirellula sp.]